MRIIFVSLLVALAAPVQAGFSWTWNFGGLTGGATPSIIGIEEAQFLGSSYISVFDNDLSGSVTAGDTFGAHSVLRFGTLTDASGDDITPLTYGAGIGADHEVTAVISVTGVHATADDYVINSLTGTFYADAGGLFSPSDFDSLATFLDGTAVEAMGFVSGDGVIDGPLDLSGTANSLTTLVDLGAIDDSAWELDLLGEPLNPDVFGVFDSNRDQTDPLGSIADFIATIGPIGGDLDFLVRNDGSFGKEIMIPEPASTIALCLLPVFLLRRRTS